MKWYGEIAFSETVETEPDIFETRPVLHKYYGELSKNYKANQGGSTSNQNITLGNELSVLADPFLMEHFHKILYVIFNGSKWRVSSVTEQYPRLILSFGELYNDDAPEEE